jgi:hypothetical protein
MQGAAWPVRRIESESGVTLIETVASQANWLMHVKDRGR